MIRHAIARLLHALADRIEPDKPKVEIQYVYVYSSPPIVTNPAPVSPGLPWQSPYWYGNTCHTN